MKLDSVSVSFFSLFGIMGFYMKSNSTSRNVKWDNLYQFSHQDNKKVYYASTYTICATRDFYKSDLSSIVNNSQILKEKLDKIFLKAYILELIKQ